MTIRQFEGSSIDSLLEQVRSEVGTNARIVRAQKVRKGGFLGFFAREFFELTVEVQGGSTSTVTKRTGANGAGRTAPRNGRTVKPTPKRKAISPGSLRGNGRTVLPSPRRGKVDDLVRQRYGALEDAEQDADVAEPAPLRDTDAAKLGTLAAPEDTRESYVPADTTAKQQGPGEDGSAVPTIEDQTMRYWAYFLTPRAPGSLDEVPALETPDVPVLADMPADVPVDAFDSLAEEEVDSLDISNPMRTAPPSTFAEVLGSLSGEDEGAKDDQAMKDGATGAGRGGDADVAEPATFEPSRAPEKLDVLTGSTADPAVGEDGSAVRTAQGPGAASAADPAVGEDGSAVRTAQGPGAASAADPAVGEDGSAVRTAQGPGAASAADPAVGEDGSVVPYLDPDEIGMVGGEVPTLPPEVIEILTRVPLAALPLGGKGPGLERWSHHGTPGAVFAPAPLMPTGLAAIGFPPALLPSGEDSELVATLGEADVDLDSGELAHRLFVEALKELPAAPDFPTGVGRMLAIVGNLTTARSLAAKLATERGVDPADVVIAAPDGEQGDVPAWMVIPSEEVAAKRRPRWLSKEQVTIVAVSAPLTTTGREWARGVLDALQPDLVCGVIESTHKPEDIASWAVELGRVDTLAIEGGRATRTPAAVLACGIPVSLIDGEEADADLWSSIVADRLAAY